jgi:hypothetical protein
MQLMSTQWAPKLAAVVLFVLCFTAVVTCCAVCHADGSSDESCACVAFCKCATLQPHTLEPDCTWTHLIADGQDRIARLLITDVFRPPKTSA